MPPILRISIHKALASLDQSRHTLWGHLILFQSTRLSRASTQQRSGSCLVSYNFNPQGSREPRRDTDGPSGHSGYFNPQGSREPRHDAMQQAVKDTQDFNPQGSREPRQQNYPTIPPHPPNFLCIMSSPPYFNLLHPFTQPIFTAFPLFFRCESPRHFMLAWHSHLV